MIISFEKKFFSFNLSSVVINSKFITSSKSGWIIKLQNKDNHVGFGEISPIFKNDLKICNRQINQIPKLNKEINIIEKISKFHPSIQSGINSAIAEIKGEIKFKKFYPFQRIEQTAILLQSNNVIDKLKFIKNNENYKNLNLTFKWKVGIQNNVIEEDLLEEILNIMPKNYKLRIDANGSWSRELANRWIEILKNNKNLDWLEQPLAADDIEGLRILNKKIPIALDESLLKFPELINYWEGWQIRRPSQEKNPLYLLSELNKNKKFISISSSFETGIGRRLLHHFALLQLNGPTPRVPGLALEQTPESFLFSSNPQIIWNKL